MRRQNKPTAPMILTLTTIKTFNDLEIMNDTLPQHSRQGVHNPVIMIGNTHLTNGERPLYIPLPNIRSDIQGHRTHQCSPPPSPIGRLRPVVNGLLGDQSVLATLATSSASCRSPAAEGIVCRPAVVQMETVCCRLL